MTSQTKRDMVIRWHERCVSPEDTARLLQIPLPEVRAIIRESQTRHPAIRTATPEFIAPPLFDADEQAE